MWTSNLLLSMVFHEAVQLLQLLQIEPDVQSSASDGSQACSGDISKFQWLNVSVHGCS